MIRHLVHTSRVAKKMASEILIALVTKLYEVVQTVQGNKERCKEISQRAQRLVPALRRVSSSGEQEVRIEQYIVSLAHSFLLKDTNVQQHLWT